MSCDTIDTAWSYFNVFLSVLDFQVVLNFLASWHPCCFVGIAAEGLGCFLCGIFGVGAGTTSYTINLGLIVVSKAGREQNMRI